MARYRTKSIVDDFGLNYIQRHGPRKGHGKKHNVGKRIKPQAQFESGSDEDDDHEISVTSGAEDRRESKSSDSYDEAESR